MFIRNGGEMEEEPLFKYKIGKHLIKLINLQ